MKIVKAFFLGVCCLVFNTSCTQEASQKPNILFIAIDDLRPELGTYGSEIAVSPHLDAFAENGLQFNKAYCQQAICGPSRASILTGYRPQTSGVYHNYIKFREANPDVVTLPQHFMAHGYETVYCGKIFHHGDLDEASWSREPAIDSMTAKGIARPKGFALAENIALRKEQSISMRKKYGEVAKYGLAMGPAYEAADVPDNGYLDGYNTELAIETLEELSKGDKPFFLGLGFNKPHLNWTSPKKYWNLYNRADITLTQQKENPKGGAAMGVHASFELRTRHNIPKSGIIENEQSITLKHAYLACISYVDAQIGRVMEALEANGLKENTIIIVWSDHGWHLGDMGIWGKATNYEIATRVPLMIQAPGMKRVVMGAKSEALVELIDMYPTLAELAGLSIPNHVEGTSFASLLEKPHQEWKSAVFSQFPTPALREWGAFPLRPAMRETFFGPLIQEVEGKIKKQQGDLWDKDFFENDLMAYAMRTAQYRLIVWKDKSNASKAPIFIELYDHSNDPSETTNIASKNTLLVQKLLKQFNKGWEGNKPKIKSI